MSLIKPIGFENEHPGYASEHTGSDHLVELLQSINGSDCAKDTMVIVTYDEFGGQWDHVSPPGQGTRTVDHGHDREPVPPGPSGDARRAGPGPLDGVRERPLRDAGTSSGAPQDIKASPMTRYALRLNARPTWLPDTSTLRAYGTQHASHHTTPSSRV